MRKNALWLILVVIAALIQTTWLKAIAIRGVEPNLILVLVVYFAIASGEERGMFTGVLGGAFQDVSGASILGHHVVCLVLVGYGVGRLTTRLITEHPAVKVAVVFTAALTNGLLYTFIEYVQSPGSNPISKILAGVIHATFYTALLSPVVFLLVYLVEQRLGRAKPKPRGATP
ncbi:MAG TPA: rod shape-determining protein MreD [Candidatus Hydrogenedentes bacterium]|nr:rod shape-determining protein MreD [Candidatus Hydrogenedentota bacterium]